MGVRTIPFAFGSAPLSKDSQLLFDLSYGTYALMACSLSVIMYGQQAKPIRR